MTKNQSKSFWVWITAVAMLMAALMPALSHSARAQSGAEALSPICTSSGMKWFDPVSGEIREQTVQSENQSSTEHCTWCSVHPPALISQPTVSPPLFLELAETFIPTYRVLTRSVVWSSSRPRAPPTVA